MFAFFVKIFSIILILNESLFITVNVLSSVFQTVSDAELLGVKESLWFAVSPDDVMWEEIPQSGEVPSAREGHTLW